MKYHQKEDLLLWMDPRTLNGEAGEATDNIDGWIMLGADHVDD